MKNVLRWVFLSGALIVGILAARGMALVPRANGGTAATMLVNDAPAMGIGVMLGYLALACVLGAIAARVFGMRTGLFAVGLTLAGPAWAGGTVASLIRFAQSGAPLRKLAVEGLILAVLGVVVAAVVCRAAKKTGHEAEVEGVDPLVSGQSAIGFAAALVTGGLAAWIVSREGLKGQTLAAAAVAGLVGATFSRVVAHRAGSVALIAGLVALAFAGPALGASLQGATAVADSYANRLFPLAWPEPIDWIAGVFIGAPLGMAWGGSMLEKRG